MRAALFLLVGLALLTPGCLVPEDRVEADGSFRVPDCVLPSELVYETTPGHHVVFRFEDVSNVPATHGAPEHALSVRIIHPEADWNNDLSKREIYSWDYPTRLGRFHFVSATPAARVARPFETSFDKCSETDLSFVPAQFFFDFAAQAGVVGEALQTADGIIRQSPQFREWASGTSAQQWVDFEVRSDDGTPTSLTSWYVTIGYVQRESERFGGRVELSATAAGLTPISITAGQEPSVMSAGIPTTLTHPTALADIRWDQKGAMRGSLEPWRNVQYPFSYGREATHSPPGILASVDERGNRVAAVSLVDGGRYWLPGDGFDQGVD